MQGKYTTTGSRTKGVGILLGRVVSTFGAAIGYGMAAGVQMCGVGLVITRVGLLALQSDLDSVGGPLEYP